MKWHVSPSIWKHIFWFTLKTTESWFAVKSQAECTLSSSGGISQMSLQMPLQVSHRKPVYVLMLTSIHIACFLCRTHYFLSLYTEELTEEGLMELNAEITNLKGSEKSNKAAG